MNVNALIDSIVRQTTVLIAQLATTAGVRAPLAHLADQVFVELVNELRQQGLGNKVIADMFGLALRTYHARVRRLSESATVQGRSLWSAVLEYVQEKETALRADILRRFRHDDEATVRGVLRDLVDSGMLFRTGREDGTTYRAARPEDYAGTMRSHSAEGLANLVWVAVSRYAPITKEELLRHVPIDEEELSRALERLVAEGRVDATPDAAAAEPVYESQRCVIPLGTASGWEASVWDHFQAMVTAISTKLASGRQLARLEDAVGGSTYTFDVWPGHPHREEVLSFLRRVRERGVALREKVEAHNARASAPDAETERVIAYVGQTVLSGAAPRADGEATDAAGRHGYEP
jgi:hypothetical protein